MKNKHRVSDFEVQQSIQNAIKSIAWKGLVNPSTNAVVGTDLTVGFVAKIHDDPEDELFGTIDVQEYDYSAVDESGEKKIGYHEGVYLGAMQDTMKGYVVIPLMYSEVVLDQDGDTGKEYVIKYSRAQYVQIDSHEKVSIGVKQREEFNLDDDKDIEDLRETGVFSNTTYTENEIVSSVNKTEGDYLTKQVLNGDEYSVSVHNDNTTLKLDDDKFEVERGNEKITVTSSTVEVGGGTMEEAVLGQKLTQLMQQLLTILSTAMTTTAMGPQPLIPAGQIAALQNQLKPMLSTHIKIQN